MSWFGQRGKIRKHTKGPVRYLFSSFIPIVALLGAAVITSNDVSYVRLETESVTVKAGETFDLAVYAFAHVPVNAVDITLEFDNEAVEVLSVDKGLSVITIWTEEPIIEKNRVILRGGTYRKGFVEEHQVASVKLRAKQVGQSVLETSNITLLAGDGKGTEVSVAEVNDSSLNLYVYDQNTDPASIGISVDVGVYSDIDNDGKVTLKDISVFMAAWAKRDRIYDFNQDNKMTFRDFSIILADFFFK